MPTYKVILRKTITALATVVVSDESHYDAEDKAISAAETRNINWDNKRIEYESLGEDEIDNH